MIRDWQKDMELASRPEFANRKMALYWLQQYAALIEDYKKCADAKHEYRRKYAILEDRFNTTSSKEKKLKLMIDDVIDYFDSQEGYSYLKERLKEDVASLYPKEGES
ncbi:MAG: hypothetical protein ACQEXX_19890 [Bacillota bacterium]